MPGRKHLSAEDAAKVVAPIIGYAPSREQIAVAFLDIDQVALREGATKRVRWERWDKTSPVNGVPAERVLASRNDYKGGDIFLVYVDNVLVYFQPHHPTLGGPMDQKSAEEAARGQVEEVIDHIATTAVIDAVIEMLPVHAPTLPEPEVSASGNLRPRGARRGSS